VPRTLHAGAVAALQLRTGEQVWRRVLEESDRLDQLQIVGRGLITLSSRGRFIRAWDLTVRLQ
jgi:hypothetical protein